MLLNAISCPNCGAPNPKRLSTGMFKCDYCDSVFSASGDTEGNLESCKVSGSMTSGLKFAVHTELIVTGSMNVISIVSKDADNARHVSTLKISGSMNTIEVSLLDGATFKDHGAMNTWR